MKLDSLQVGRALAALYVLFFHARVAVEQDLEVPFPNVFFEAGHKGVDFFFVLSGFIIFLVHGKDVARPKNAGRYFYKRFVRIYPLFWITMLLTTLGQALFTQIEDSILDPVSLIQALLLFPFPVFPPLIVAWTLSHEILFYIVAGLAILYGRRGMVFAGLWWGGCLVSLGIILVTGKALAFPLDFVFSPLNLLFAAGMAAAALSSRLTPAAAWTALVAGFALCACLIMPSDLNKQIDMLLFGLGCALMIAGGVAIERRYRPRLPRVLVFLGDASYSIYLIHVPALTLAGIVLLKVYPGVSVWEAFAIISFAATMVGVAFHLVVERPLLAFFARRGAAKVDPVSATVAK